jgi:ribosomal protein L7/L12
MGIFGRSDQSADDGGLRRRVEELERRVAALEWALRGAGGGTAVSPSAPAGEAVPVSAEVRALAMQGKKIQAIKVLRDETGLGLKESKDIVDRLAP